MKSKNSRSTSMPEAFLKQVKHAFENQIPLTFNDGNKKVKVCLSSEVITIGTPMERLLRNESIEVKTIPNGHYYLVKNPEESLSGFIKV